MSIYEAQNSKANLRLLAAQRHIYGQTKTFQQWHQLGTIGLLAIAPLIYYLFPDSRTILAIVGALWVIISRLLLEAIEKQKTKDGATIQEEFDVGLFELPWNHVLVGNKVNPELISSAAAAYKGKKELLENWYPDTNKLPYPLNVLLCQRANLVWDWRLRRHYAWAIGSLTVLLFVSGIMLAFVTNLTLLDYLLALLIPSLAALLGGIEATRAQLTIATEKVKLEDAVSSFWKSGLENPESITRNHCREVQNSIYTLRCQSQLVPDRFYFWLQSRYEVDMRSAVEDLKREAIKTFESNSY